MPASLLHREKERTESGNGVRVGVADPAGASAGGVTGKTVRLSSRFLCRRRGLRFGGVGERLMEPRLAAASPAPVMSTLRRLTLASGFSDTGACCTVSSRCRHSSCLTPPPKLKTRASNGTFAFLLTHPALSSLPSERRPATSRRFEPAEAVPIGLEQDPEPLAPPLIGARIHRVQLVAKNSV